VAACPLLARRMSARLLSYAACLFPPLKCPPATLRLCLLRSARNRACRFASTPVPVRHCMACAVGQAAGKGCSCGKSMRGACAGATGKVAAAQAAVAARCCANAASANKRCCQRAGYYRLYDGSGEGLPETGETALVARGGVLAGAIAR